MASTPTPRFLYLLCPHLLGAPASAFSPLLFSPADEMTVGKVYAALMIFDFYKQSKTSRDQTLQAPGGLSQVLAPGLPGRS